MLSILIITSLKALLAAGAIALVTYYLLRYTDILDWFRAWIRDRGTVNRSTLTPFTMQQMLASGQYETVQGFWDSVAEEVTDARVVRSRQVDPELARIHARQKLAVYA